MIKKGICIQTLIPVRQEPSECSEMITQLLFGDLYTILETNHKWAYVEANSDKYCGWIDLKLVNEISLNEFETLLNSTHKILSKPLSHLKKSDSTLMPIVAGSTFYSNSEKGFCINNTCFSYPEDTTLDTLDIESISTQFINAPYLWGGKSMLGIDCSGLTQVVFKIVDIQLPRDASEQAKKGTTVSFISEAKVGDLAFFDNEEGKIIHVGIILNNNRIIHASGLVRIDKIDHQGIFNIDTKEYSHKLRIIKHLQ